MQYKQKGAHIIEAQLDEFLHPEHTCVNRTGTFPKTMEFSAEQMRVRTEGRKY